MKPEIRDLSLYIHIPFCKAKCIYCDFLSFGGCGHDKQKQYIDALCKEIAAYSKVAKEYRVRTANVGWREIQEPDFSKYTLIEK